MLSLVITPEALAMLIKGDALVFRLPDSGEPVQIYVHEQSYIDDSVAAAILQVLPFMGERH
jgi:hypothetical protein